MLSARAGRRVLFVFAGTLLALAGCQPPVTEVSGTIKLKGQPLKMKGLEINFMGVDGKPAGAAINPEDGTYAATDVRSGEVKVYFVYVDAKKVGADKSRPIKPPSGKDGGVPKGSGDSEAKNPIPMKFRDASTTDITTTLKAGQKNTFDYDFKELHNPAPAVP